MYSQIRLSLFAAGLVVSASGVGADDEGLYYFEEVAGSSISNALGGKTFSGEGRSSLGRVRVVAHTSGSKPDESISCPNGEMGLPLTAFSVRTDSWGEQLYGRGEGFMCVNSENGTLTSEGIVNITGGTGLFEHASGQLNFSGRGTALFLDKNTLQSFSAVELSSEGYIYLSYDDDR